MYEVGTVVGKIWTILPEKNNFVGYLTKTILACHPDQNWTVFWDKESHEVQLYSFCLETLENGATSPVQVFIYLHNSSTVCEYMRKLEDKKKILEYIKKEQLRDFSMRKYPLEVQHTNGTFENLNLGLMMRPKWSFERIS